MLLSLREQISTHHARLTDTNRSCDKCHQPAPAGESLQIAAVHFATVSIPFSICNSCAAEELARFADHSMSHEAADVFMSHQRPAGLNNLCGELVSLQEWIACWTAPGKRCDECSAALVEGDPVSTATLPVSGLTTGCSILHVVCPRCAKGPMFNIKANCTRFLARAVSDRATAFIHGLLTPQTVVN